MYGKCHYNGTENELKLLRKREHFLYHYRACCHSKMCGEGHFKGTENALKLLREREHFLYHYCAFAIKNVMKRSL